MKTRYIFIHCDGTLNTDTIIYYVMVGNSPQEKRDLDFFQSLKFQTSVFFEKDSKEVSDFIQRIAGSLYPGVTCPLLAMYTRSIEPRELRQLILSRTFDSVQLPKGYSYTRENLDPKFYALKNGRYGK